MSLSLSQYGLYLQYLFTALGMTGVFAMAYVHITPPREVQLIRNGNLACALSFGGALVGFAIALVSAMTHSIGLLDFVIWGLLAATVQIALFFVVSRVLPDAVTQLEANNVAMGAFLCALSVAIGLLNAACLVG